jgi:catechol 2,3-dioxygenase-like lactoylglutathione lyase family enzyme
MPLSLGARAETILPGLVKADLQIGCIVRDLEASARLWTAILGIGPWIAVDGYPGFTVHWKGRKADIGIAVAFTYFGDTQVELIQPIAGMDSPYAEFVAGGGDGFHHFGLLAHDVDAALAAAAKAGLSSAFELSFGDSPGRTIYFSAPPGVGSLIEIVDYSPGRRKAFQGIKRLADGWDGSDPFRRYPTMKDFVASLG